MNLKEIKKEIKELRSKTIYNYIENGTFEKNYHYFYNKDDKIEFVENAIIKFKQDYRVNNHLSKQTTNIRILSKNLSEAINGN